MSQKFLTWATLSLGPVKATQLHDSFELASLVLEDDVWEVAEQPYFRSNIDSPGELQTWIQSQAYMYIVRACQAFGVTIDESVGIEAIGNINSILRTLIELTGDFQLPEEVISLEDMDCSDSEKLTKMVTIVETWVEEEDVLGLISDMSLKVIPRILNNCKSLMPPETDEIDEPVTPKYLAQVSALIKSLERSSMVSEYFSEGNALGYSLAQYMTVFGGFLATLEEPKELAINLMLVLYYTEDLSEPQQKDLLRILDKIVPDIHLAADVGVMLTRMFKELSL
jgi:hypothetical protein